MTIKVCVDRVFSDKDPYKGPMPLYDPERREMAVERDKRWKKQNLRARFLNGDSEIQRKVQQQAKQWEQYANIKLQFGSDNDSEIRIAFKWNNDPGSWSFIGTDAVTYTDNGNIPKDSPTMNYGWLEHDTPDDEYSRVVIHEFGHALGAIHEHQSPAAGIPWDKEAVYRYFMGPPNNWSKEDIDHNLFERYNKNIMNYSEFDPKSIMLYPIAAEFTTNHQAIGGRNTQPSETDKQFMKTQYP